MRRTAIFTDQAQSLGAYQPRAASQATLRLAGPHSTVADEPRVQMSVSVSPQVSVLSMIGAVCGRRGDVPLKLREYVLSRVSPFYLLDAWRPMRSMADGFAPDVVAPNWRGDVSVHEFVEWLRSEGPAALVRQFRNARPSEAAAWARELDDPRRWVNAYANASVSTWAAMRPLWDSRIKLIETEMQRIGLAQVRGTAFELLNVLHPSISFRGGVLTIGASQGEPLEVPVGSREINLVPMIAASQSWYASVDGHETITLAYGLPRSTAEREARLGSGADPITLLLGHSRAEALHYVRRPRRVGELAQHLSVAPSTATHHCDVLEKAGLVTRTRQGKSVLVSLTERGQDILEILRA